MGRWSKKIYKKNCTGAIFFSWVDGLKRFIKKIALVHFFYWVALRSDPALPDLNGRENNPIEPSIGRQLDGLKKLHRCNFLSWVALRSDPTMPDLNIREQGHICGHMSTDIPIVPDRVGVCPLRVQGVIFSASGRENNPIEPSTGGRLDGLNNILINIGIKKKINSMLIHPLYFGLGTKLNNLDNIGIEE